MSRKLFFERADNWIGEFPHDPEAGWITGRRGLRRTLCKVSSLTGLSHDEKIKQLMILYNAKATEIRNAQFKAEEQKKKKQRERKKLTIRQASNLWLDEVKATNNIRSWKSYDQTIGIYLQLVGNHPLADFDRERNIEFYKALQGREYGGGKSISNTTQNKHMRQLQAFLNWAYNHEYIQRQINLKKAPVPLKDMDTIEISELIMVREHLEKAIASETNPRRLHRLQNLYRAFKMATNCLLRLGAIWSLKLEQIDLKRREIRIRDNAELGWTNKKFKWPNKPINDSLFEFLEQDLASRPPEHRYFLDNGKGGPWHSRTDRITAAMKEIFKELDLPDIKPFHHGFRATMITELLTQGEDPYAVQQLADHNNLATTLQYLNRRKVSQLKAANALPGL